MDSEWLKDLNEKLPGYLKSLNKEQFQYLPVKTNFTKAGEELSLGFSCYALKLFYITNLWENLDDLDKKNWCSYINSFQVNSSKFPPNSFIDNKFLEYSSDFSLKKQFKNLSKAILNFILKKNYILNNQKLEESIRAETKQAIATLNQVGASNKLPYLDFLRSNEEVNTYLRKLDWSKPWNAGAQFAAVCVFVETQIKSDALKQELIRTLKDFSILISHKDTGLFYLGNKPSEVELVNGAMKVITGLDWIGVDIPYPKELINTFLNIKPSEDGCDLVDTVYVLYMCSKITDYKSSEVKEFLIEILEMIKMHYFPNIGGFSYFKKTAQTHYYGVQISKGTHMPDIHGTLLLAWAISMISKLISLPTSHWKVLKP